MLNKITSWPFTIFGLVLIFIGGLYLGFAANFVRRCPKCEKCEPGTINMVYKDKICPDGAFLYGYNGSTWDRIRVDKDSHKVIDDLAKYYGIAGYTTNIKDDLSVEQVLVMQKRNLEIDHLFFGRWERIEFPVAIAGFGSGIMSLYVFVKNNYIDSVAAPMLDLTGLPYVNNYILNSSCDKDIQIKKCDE